jgi:hypothetical protein
LSQEIIAEPGAVTGLFQLAGITSSSSSHKLKRYAAICAVDALTGLLIHRDSWQRWLQMPGALGQLAQLLGNSSSNLQLIATCVVLDPALCGEDLLQQVVRESDLFDGLVRLLRSSNQDVQLCAQHSNGVNSRHSSGSSRHSRHISSSRHSSSSSSHV